MSRIAILLTFAACLTGCATSRPSAQLSPANGFEPDGHPTVFNPDQLAEIPIGRFCRVRSIIPDTLHEGMLVSASADEVVLSNAAAVGPRTMGLFGNLPFEWSRRTSHGTDVTFPARVAISRATIAAVDVFDAEESSRLCDSFAKWRARQQWIREQLLTEQEFPSSG